MELADLSEVSRNDWKKELKREINAISVAPSSRLGSRILALLRLFIEALTLELVR
jgi:hypothetical protein